MNIEKLRKEMTREEFLNDTNLTNTEGCPNEYKLKEYESCKCKDITCKECWRNAVKDIKFKDDIEVKKLSKRLNIIEAMKMPIGTEFKVAFKDGSVSNHIVSFGNCKFYQDKHVDDSIHVLFINATFIPIQKPVSFMEVVNSGKKCRVEHELVNREVLNGSTMLLAPEAEEMKNGEYIDLNWVLYFLGYSIDADNVKRVIKEGKWYIEESEEE